jgi:hypothetical protein
MRYMFLVYSRELPPDEIPDMSEVRAKHFALMAETQRLGIFHGASPLQPTSTATTVRMQNDKPLLLDGPFAETKEQLAGYYILECKDLDEAIGWAAKIPTACKGMDGCIEIRPLAAIPPRD